MRNFFKNINLNKFFEHTFQKDHLFYGQISFLTGIVLLPSALPLSILFLLISISISIKKQPWNFFFEKYNINLLITGLLMIISCSARLVIPSEYELSYLAKNSWVDLLNWIPLFISFYGFQSYLKTSKQRILFGKAFIVSTFPVILSCIFQYWFKIFGPFSTFFGLITWYQKPFENDQSGLTGLFSNPNYTGYWLATILPFSFYFFIKNKNKKFKNYFFLINFLLIIYLLINTSSRNALLSVSISTLSLLSYKLLIFCALLLFITFIIINLINPLLLINLAELFKIVLPTKLVEKFLLFYDLNINNFHRIDIFKNSINLIFKKPIFGWGATTFGILYTFREGISPATHTHNLILELAYNYGIIISLIITYFIFDLLFKCWLIFKKISNKKSSFIDRLWLISTITSVLFHMNDIPYYDGKISILFWILIAGVKCIVCEEKDINIKLYQKS